MALNKSIFILLFPFLIFASECPDDFIVIDDDCYYKKHFDVLQDFIDKNISLQDMEPQKIGTQEWKNGKLVYLYLGDHLLTSLPNSIGLLSNLGHLDIRKNQITDIPDGICILYPYQTQLTLFNNNICPPYPYCFEYISHQNTTICESFECPDDYMEIEGECYKKSHVNILQSIIDNNKSLVGKNPLELGNEIGYQHWENGKLIFLSLMSNELTNLPEDICSIYHELKSFDVSNNFICPPYPSCIEYLGRQNTQNCSQSDEEIHLEEDQNITDNRKISTQLKNKSDMNAVYFQNDLNFLQHFIDNNESLKGQEPLEIGSQKWGNMRLISLDLSNTQLTTIPNQICSISTKLNNLDLSGNSICPPYPICIKYVGNQNTTNCSNYICPDKYIEIDGQCYFEAHMQILQDIIDSNNNLEGLKPLEIARDIGHQQWLNGKLVQLILSGNKLTSLPESICNIYSQLSSFDISNNFLCPPYPDCIEHMGYQNTQDCNITCSVGYVAFDEKCYYYEDLRVLIDFTRQNSSIEKYHPLALGYQVWENKRLQLLYLNDMEISIVPKSIENLDQLEYLNLNNNKLDSLPTAICKIYSNLKGIDLTNNILCPPYLDCFDYIGQQNTENCPHDFCPYGYREIDGQCYYRKDLEVLQDFIDQNPSLEGRSPQEIGVQKWKNMRLDFLYLGVNKLTVIPESICDIYSNLSSVNISGNNICPPYPICMEEIVGDQNTSSCP